MRGATGEDTGTRALPRGHPTGTDLAVWPRDTLPFPEGSAFPVPITELLDRVPFSPGSREPRPEAASATEAERTFEIELPSSEIDGAIPIPDRALPTDDLPEPPPDAAPRRPAPAPADRPPMPSWGIALVGGLSLVCLALTAALALAVAEPDRIEAAPPPADTPSAAAPAAVPSAPAELPAAPPTVSPASFPADPAPIPVDLLTRLEEASDEPLDVELSRLLDAIQHGFGQRSTQLEPTLRSYVYRMASRFEWNPDAFRVAVTAPDPGLASARAALLERLFEDAVAAGRLEVGTGVGPHALTLVTE